LGAGNAPVILFSKASNHLLECLVQTGADVLSVDWRVDLHVFRERFGGQVAVQGNVDPSTLLAPEEAICGAARFAVEQTGGRGHILNLGHGILPDTPVENALAFVRAGQSAPVASFPRSATRELAVTPKTAPIV
jgi:uroporphyrinogen decarboxylase